jgi:uncharacterized protein (DUF433 family)
VQLVENEEGHEMESNGVQIVDYGRGPQIEGHRLTVMDVFYYLHRGYDFDFIHRAMPSLSREQFDAVVAYVMEHRDELVEKDRRVDESHRRGMEAQHARGGIFAASEENLTTEERLARLRQKIKEKQQEDSRARHPD